MYHQNTPVPHSQAIPSCYQGVEIFSGLFSAFGKHIQDLVGLQVIGSVCRTQSQVSHGWSESSDGCLFAVFVGGSFFGLHTSIAYKRCGAVLSGILKSCSWLQSTLARDDD